MLEVTSGPTRMSLAIGDRRQLKIPQVNFFDGSRTDFGAKSGSRLPMVTWSMIVSKPAVTGGQLIHAEIFANESSVRRRRADSRRSPCGDPDPPSQKWVERESAASCTHVDVVLIRHDRTEKIANDSPTVWAYQPGRSCDPEPEAGVAEKI
ncbi:hypothetical protein EVAR_64786_1 [Eumeta japonica]|uniref:Uncharacterized protein n=1 Tax=Eumeta variegata TaxID=151549 RepID=A0A4C1ZQ04_EUMVA|nr:hypothetical protein EVAR_64786_1 [Eumeta japonica]